MADRQKNAPAADLVLEIGTEEIPARFLPPALEQIARIGRELLEKHRLDYAGLVAWGGPRRLTLFVKNLGHRQRPAIREIQGPPKAACFDERGRPTLALERFARNCEVGIQEVEFRETARGAYAFAVLRRGGESVAKVLPEILAEIVGALNFPKKMAWDATGFSFARPIRSLLCLHGSRVVRLSLAGIPAGRSAQPASPLEKPIPVPSASRYLETLRRRGLLADPAERRACLEKMCRQAAAVAGGEPDLSGDVLEEITHLAESPAVVTCSFDASYLTLPAEVLRLCILSKQRFIPIRKEGRLLPRFLGIRNGRSENQAQVRRGFERVLEARLADAKFFLERDRRKTLEMWAGRLEGISYLAGAGTLADKAHRLARLAEKIALDLGCAGETAASARRAALLCKADLATELVGEYPELQGAAGGLYAEASGEPREVAAAIREHYLPVRPQDPIPASAAGRCLALADKMDHLACGFGAGGEPSGAYDPLGLKRAADGILRIVLEADLALDLAPLLEEAAAGANQPPEKVRPFLRQRLSLLLQEKGMRPDEVEAVFAVPGEIWMRPCEAMARCRCLREVRNRPEFGLLAEVFTRARNILEQAKTKGLWSEGMTAEDGAGEEPAQRNLREAWERIRPGVEERISAGDFGSALAEVATLQPPMSEFFEKCLVMAEDPAVRASRLALLARVRNLVLAVADLSCLNQTT